MPYTVVDVVSDAFVRFNKVQTPAFGQLENKIRDRQKWTVLGGQDELSYLNS
jgi:hypothetical protein